RDRGAVGARRLARGLAYSVMRTHRFSSPRRIQREGRDMRKVLVLAGARFDATSAALARATALAEPAGAAIVLLGVVYDPHLEGYLGRSEIYDPLRERLVAERKDRLRAVAAGL